MRGVCVGGWRQPSASAGCPEDASGSASSLPGEDATGGAAREGWSPVSRRGEPPPCPNPSSASLFLFVWGLLHLWHALRLGPAAPRGRRVCAPRGRDAASPARAVLGEGWVSLPRVGPASERGDPPHPRPRSHLPPHPGLYFPGSHGGLQPLGLICGSTAIALVFTPGVKPPSPDGLLGGTAGREQKRARNPTGEGELAGRSGAGGGHRQGRAALGDTPEPGFYLFPCQVNVPPRPWELH